MQKYTGPKTRLLSRNTGETGFRKEGQVRYQEKRDIFIKQTFDVEQVHTSIEDDEKIPDEYFELSERDIVQPQAGSVGHFTETHDFSRLSLNKTCSDVQFKPDQAFNRIEILNQHEMQLSPYLCPNPVFENVTRKPDVTYTYQGNTYDGVFYPNQREQTVRVQTGAYNRFWFGFLNDVQNAVLAGHTGLGPIANAAPLQSTAFGLFPRDFHTGQTLRPHSFLDQVGHFGLGEVQWHYDAQKNLYYLPSISIHVPMEKMFADFTDPVTVNTPILYTQNTTQYKQNYFFLDETDTSAVLPHSVIGVTIHENQNMKDFVAVPLTPAVVNADGTAVRTLYWFVPKFRILSGNSSASQAKPRKLLSGNRVALDIANAPYMENNEPYKFSLGGTVAQVLARETIRWSDFFYRKHEVEWDYIKVADLVVAGGAGHVHRYLQFADYPIEENESLGRRYTRELIEEIYEATVTNRLVLGAFNPTLKTLHFILATDGHVERNNNLWMRLAIDNLNSWRNGAGLALAHADEDVVGSAAVFAATRNIQMEDGAYEESELGFLRSDDGVDATVPEYNEVTAAELVAAALVSEAAVSTLKRRNAKPFYFRGVVNFCNAGAYAAAVNFPNVANAFWGTHSIYLPFKKDQVNTPYGLLKETVTSYEPFFGYTSGTNSLQCQHPLNTTVHGEFFPGCIQDYRYVLNRKWNAIFSNGFIHDKHYEVKVTPQTELEFITISEMSDSFKQEDKSVSRIGEITHQIVPYSVDFEIADTPRIRFETRSGNFEYVFLYITYIKTSEDGALPTKNPIITSLNLSVRGKDNLFLQSLDKYELERITRSNSHTLSKFRDLYEAGQGCFLHLSDLGLQNEQPFPARGRVELEFQLLSQESPEVEIFGDDNTQAVLDGANQRKRRLHVVLYRSNWLLRGNTQDMRFTYLNEE